MSGAVMAIVPDSPQQAGGYWVLPSIDAASGGEVSMHVAIAVGDVSDLKDVDVQVVVVAGGRSLAVVRGPPGGVLPTIQLNAINAYAQYVFANPGDPPPQTVQVTIRGGTTSFDVSGGVV
jgi:hypothetical protein